MSSPPPDKLKVLLVANYPIDRQQSMQRFAQMLAAGMTERGHDVKTIFPQPLLGRIRIFGSTAAKWLAYFDKFVFFQFRLFDQAKKSAIVHICDHSNSLYVPAIKHRPHLITCHDLLAVRAGLGEDTAVDLNPTGKFLQHLILKGLRTARTIVCDSHATMADAQRLIGELDSETDGSRRIKLVSLDLNRKLGVLPQAEVSRRLSSISTLDQSTPFLLHVGSSLRRKNRAGLLRIFSKVKERFPGQLVFCGAPLPQELVEYVNQSGLNERVVQVVGPTDDILEALYNSAFALVFPSLSEGFGWPIIEAQACDCPVICSNTSSCPEAAGGAALLRDPHDEEGFAEDILKLMDQPERHRLIQLGRENAKCFSAGRTVEEYERIYYAVLAQDAGKNSGKNC